MHYVKALAAGAGDLRGLPNGYRVGSEPDRRLDFVNRNSRAFAIPPGLNPPAPCFQDAPFTPAPCLNGFPTVPGRVQVSYVASYPPFLYVPVGLAIRAAGREPAALYAGRAAGAAICLGLLLGALGGAARAARAGPALWGILLAATPMLVYLASSVGTSGIEAAAGVAFPSLLLLGGGRPLRWWGWAGVGLAGALLATARPLGPAWVVMDVALAAVVSGPHPLWRWLRAGRLGSLLALAGLAAAVVGSLTWTVRYGVPGPLPHGLSGLPAAVHESRLHARELIGSFGLDDVSLPRPVYVAWATAVACYLGAAFWRAGRRLRVILPLALAAAVAITVAVAALIILPTGFGMQGRYVFPAAAAVLVAAAVALGEVRRPLPGPIPAVAGALVAVLVAGVQVLAFVVNGKRYAVGSAGPVWFVPDAVWAPPAGWLPWLGLAGLGAGALLAGALLLVRPPAGNPGDDEAPGLAHRSPAQPEAALAAPEP